MRRAAIPLTLAALAAAMDAGCAPRDNSVISSPLFSAEELAEFMGTREERAARAPYSPPGWPLQRGDTISDARLRELKRDFGHYCGEIRAPFWVGDMVFGAGFRSSVPDDVIIVGTLPGDHIVDTVARWGTKAHPSQVHRRIYTGHHRRYLWNHVPARKEGLRRCASASRLPPHLRAHGPGVLAVPMSERQPAGIWTQERWLEGYVGEGR